MRLLDTFREINPSQGSYISIKHNTQIVLSKNVKKTIDLIYIIERTPVLYWHKMNGKNTNYRVIKN